MLLARSIGKTKISIENGTQTQIMIAAFASTAAGALPVWALCGHAAVQREIEFQGRLNVSF